MSAVADVHVIRRQLDAGAVDCDAAVEALAAAAYTAPTRAARIDAYRTLGDVAGGAFDAVAETADKAAWVLIDLAHHTDAPQERCGLLRAMGRGFRNAWLVPFVHSRLSDADAGVVAAAIDAAGGLGFAGLEDAVAAFLTADAPRALRLAAIAALGRMGAQSATTRLLALLEGDSDEAAAALAALTEIRAPAGTDAALALLETYPERPVLLAAVRYLAELGRGEVLPTLRRLARDDDAELRIAAGFASRALKAERNQDAVERILVALSERDRAVRAALARRLRTVPAAQVLEQAELLLTDDADGVVQVLAELRQPEITRYLLELARRSDLTPHVRASAIGAVEASEPWVREALAEVIAGEPDAGVRAAAAQGLGAFVSVDELFRIAGALAVDPLPALRGAFLWALQLAGRPGKLGAGEAERCREALQRMFTDDDARVRRRAAYVAGNLRIDGLARALVALAKAEKAYADLRVAAFTGLAELASAPVLADVVALARKEEDPQALAAASRAIARTALADTQLRFESLHAKIARMLESKDAVVRRAGARLAGLSRGGVPVSALIPLATDAAPRVREEAFTALARGGGAAAEQPLLDAFEDPDPAVHERAAEALLALGGEKPLLRLLAFVSGEASSTARAAIAARLEIAGPMAARLSAPLDEALRRVSSDDAVYEPLLELKVKVLEQTRGERHSAGDVEASITAAFPTYTRLAKVRGFEQLGRSLRTAEALYGTATGLDDADMSPPIVLWMKCMEGYVHAWLAGRLQTLQRDSMMLFDHVDRLMLESWPSYQRFVSERWKDSVDVGQAHVEIPLRALSNTLREFQERRRKRLDSPLSVTEWARMMVFLGVDHPAGVRNLLKVSSKNADQVVRLAHRLHTLAAVRNLVTHRAAAGAPTLDAFRKAYYAAFEELIKLA